MGRVQLRRANLHGRVQRLEDAAGGSETYQYPGLSAWGERFPERGHGSVPVLRPYQLEVARAVLTSVRERAGLSFSVMVSRQGGKNELSAQLEAALLARYASWEANNVKASPTIIPQGKVSLARLVARLRGFGSELGEATGYQVRLGRATQTFLSAKPTSSVVGQTASVLLECDEAQDVDPEKWGKDFRPMAAAGNATTVYYGTAWTETDLLASVKAEHLEAEARDGIRRHFEYDWRVVAASNPAYGRFVEAERARLGEDHPLFSTQYELRPLAGSGRMFAPGTLALLAGSHPRLQGPAGSVGGRRVLGFVAGVDVAGEQLSGREPDATVATIARVIAAPPERASGEPDVEVVQQVVWRGAPYAEMQAGVVRLLRDDWRVVRVVVDATGMGEGLASALASARLDVEHLRLSERSKSDAGYGLIAAVQGGRLRLYADESPERAATLWELGRLRAEYRSNKLMRWYVPESEGHDDHAASLALCVRAAAGMTPLIARGRQT